MKIINGIGITDANGFSFLTYDEKFSLYKEYGFTSVMIWWGDDAESREERVTLARKHGLHIEDVHSDFNNMNSIWIDSEDGDIKYKKLIEEIEDCHKYGIDTIVMHLTNGDNPPKISDIGIKRLEGIFELASRLDVTIAIENVRNAEALMHVLDKYTGDSIKFCYDCGHEHLWTREIDWTNKYNDRVAAIHLHNNRGEQDEHLRLTEGDINLSLLASKLRGTNYEGSLTIESVYKGEPEIDNLRVFLKELYEEGKDFLELLRLDN